MQADLQTVAPQGGARRESYERLRLALEAWSQALLVFDEQHQVPVCSDRFRNLLEILPRRGHEEPDLLSLLRSSRLLARGGPGCADGLFAVIEASAEDADGSEADFAIANGPVLTVAVRPQPGGLFVVTLDDPSQRQSAAMSPSVQARHDALTGLGNRVVLREQLDLDLQRLTALLHGPARVALWGLVA